MPSPERLDDIISDSEELVSRAANERGLVRAGEDERKVVEVPIGLVVTDRRLLFVAVEGGVVSKGAALSYGELADVDVDEAVTLTTTEGVRWEYPLGERSSGRDPVCRHLRWVGDVRRRLLTTSEDVELAVERIEAQTANLNWERARETYGEARANLDDLIWRVDVTAPLDDAVLAPELGELCRTLERGHARLYIERAASQLGLGRQLVENDDYEQARKVLQQAQRYYERARGRRDVIERGDAFQFGEQRELESELADLGWEIETVAAEPIRLAHEAKIRAENATDPAEAVGHWETAFRRYGNVLTLEWVEDGRQFAADPDAVRTEMGTAARQLVDNHEEVARTTWNDGTRLEAEGNLEAAIARCLAATGHLDRALELAREVTPSRAQEFETRLEMMVETIDEMRARVGEPTHVDGTDFSDRVTEELDRIPDDPVDGSGESERRSSVADLSGTDSHHELALSADDVSGKTDDSGLTDHATRHTHPGRIRTAWGFTEETETERP